MIWFPHRFFAGTSLRCRLAVVPLALVSFGGNVHAQENVLIEPPLPDETEAGQVLFDDEEAPPEAAPTPPSELQAGASFQGVTARAVSDGDAAEIQRDASGQEVIPLAGVWLYKAEELMPARHAGEGPYISLPGRTSRHPWSERDLDTEGWREMLLPGPWEEQAFAFDGITWWRRTFVLPDDWDIDVAHRVQLSLGAPSGARDDVTVYLDGQELPRSEHKDLTFALAPSQVGPGREHVIAVRVTDAQGPTGLIGWPDDLYLEAVPLRLSESKGEQPAGRLSLAGPWRFEIEDFQSGGTAGQEESGRGLQAGWHLPEFEDTAWQEFALPGALEDDRFEHDGAIVFRREAVIPDDWAGSPLTLHLGHLADADRVWFNGSFLGESANNRVAIPLRQYKVPAEIVLPGRNVITVHIFNRQFEGGFLGPAEEMKLTPGFAGEPLPMGDNPEPAEVEPLEIGDGLDEILEEVAPESELLNLPEDARELVGSPALHTETPAAEVFRPARARWAPEFSIAQSDPNARTAADIPGPDEIVFPDFRFAGIQSGIPAEDSLSVVAKVDDFGARANDGKDDQEAIEKAIAQAGESPSGGVILFGPGTYHFSRPLIIEKDGVVLRGAGQEQTTLACTYAPSRKSVRITQPADGSNVGPFSYLEAHCDEDRLEKLELYLNDTLITRRRARGRGGDYKTGCYLFQVKDRLSALTRGQVELRAVATWQDGTVAEDAHTVHLDMDAPRPPEGTVRQGPLSAAINFRGDEISGRAEPYFLAADGRRGETSLELGQLAETLAPGDAVLLSARSTPGLQALLESPDASISRTVLLRVEEVDRARIRVNQPLRLDFPKAADSRIIEHFPIRRAGVEHLTLTQEVDMGLHGIAFTHAWECWVRHVTVRKAGRRPVSFGVSKFCEVRDSTFEDAWRPPFEGTGFVGWSSCWDSLMENVTVRRLPHSPSFQWGASGNVIRASTFTEAGGAFATGWATENLLENCVVAASDRRGWNGQGLTVGAPGEGRGGPGGGPRNVIYNNRITSPRTGIWLGGMNERWLILHNVITVQRGPAIYAQRHSLGHLIKGNTLNLAQPWQPAIRLKDADCLHLEIIGNTINGTSRILAGRGKPGLLRDNVVDPAWPGLKEIGGEQIEVSSAAEDSVSTPGHPPLSILEWQRSSN